MEAALQPRRRAAAFEQAPAAVRADVVVGPDALGRFAHDDDRFVVDVVGDVVAGYGISSSRQASCQTRGHSSRFSSCTISREM
jgi:hypothetical protein